MMDGPHADHVAKSKLRSDLRLGSKRDKSNRKLALLIKSKSLTGS